MSTHPAFTPGGELRTTARALTHVVEFKAYAYPLAGAWTAVFPSAPGAVVRNGMGRCELLHFAPGRWLAPEPSPELAARLTAAAAAGAGVQIGVDGKWHAITIAGPGAQRALARTVALDAILAARDCAALTLFDCPSIIARSDAAFDIWVQSSYAADFVASLENG
jgi:heterotetrameric sarcosine oxidase gamma subunit